MQADGRDVHDSSAKATFAETVSLVAGWESMMPIHFMTTIRQAYVGQRTSKGQIAQNGRLPLRCRKDEDAPRRLH